MRLKTFFLWGLAIVMVMSCCVAVVVSALWPIYSGSTSGSAVAIEVDTATPTPIPVIDRQPVEAAPTSPPSPTLNAPDSPENSSSRPPESEPERPGAGAGLTSPIQLSTEELLTQAILPVRDQRLLAMRLKNKGQPIPKVAVDREANYQVGHSKTFWVTDNQSLPPKQFQVNATLRYVTDHSYWWVENGFHIDDGNLAHSAEKFERQTYPVNREFFGSEWSPGIDSDVRVHIFMGNVPGVAGYFSASNSYSRLAEPYSNEHEMFFINLQAISPGNDNFEGVLAHEFQHMIHWFQDRNEETWVNEGMSELATFINGYGVSSFVGAYSQVPDTQLNSWSDTPGTSLANYGGSFLFMAYFLQRYGEEMTRAVVSHAQNGIEGFDAVLTEYGYSERFTDIFADFVVANVLQDPSLNDGRWGYRNLNVPPVTLTERRSTYPVEQQTTVFQFGGDFIELNGNGDLTVEFTGSTSVKVVDNQPQSGQYQWYSHRGDDTNTRLTRAFDLSQVEQATLNYWSWYDIEKDWDYGYVEISTDGGQTWTILQTPHSATDNPSGNAYGPGYTGKSGGGETAEWIEESLDLTPYAGQTVQLRFEYVTDDAVNRPGWTIDDISIPEIDFFDDVENGADGWQAEGFVRIDNVLPQHFGVQLLEIGSQINHRSIPLDETNRATFTVAGLGSRLDRAILIVSGLTPITTEPASYQYSIRQ